MSTAVVPATAMILNQIRISLPGIRFYRFGTEWYEFSCAGNLYRIPPDLPGNPKIKNAYPVRDSDGRIKPGQEKVTADGVLEIKSRFGTYIPMKENVPFDAKNRIYGLLPGESAEEVAEYILRVHGPKGVVMLTGDPRRDAELRDLSKRTVVAARRADDEALIAAYRERLDNWERHPNKAAIPKPRPTPAQKAAQVRIDALRETGEAAGRFICSHGCAVETNDWDEYSTHMQRAHGVVAVRPVMAPIDPAVADALAASAVTVGTDPIAPEPAGEGPEHDTPVTIPTPAPVAGRTLRGR